MAQRPHGVESVRGMARARGDGSASYFEIRIRMPEADADSAPLRLGNHFQRALQLRRNGHQSDMAPRCLPEFLERLHARCKQMLRRMRTATRVAKKWPFEMDAQRLCAAAISAICILDRIRHALRARLSITATGAATVVG